MATELHVEPHRLRELATTFDHAAKGVGAVNANTTSPEVAGTLAGSATADACHNGGHSASAALQVVTGHYRVLHAGTHTSAEDFESHDTERGRQFDALRNSL